MRRVLSSCGSKSESHEYQRDCPVLRHDFRTLSSSKHYKDCFNFRRLKNHLSLKKLNFCCVTHSHLWLTLDAALRYSEMSMWYCVHSKYLQEVNLAWKRKSDGREQEVTETLGHSLRLVIDKLFLKGEPVNRLNFIEICQFLWQWSNIVGNIWKNDCDGQISFQ